MSFKTTTKATIVGLISLYTLISCYQDTPNNGVSEQKPLADSSVIETPKSIAITANDIIIERGLLYDKHTLLDFYPYKDTIRSFQWQKIKERLALVENIQQSPALWGILQNYKNKNGEAPLVRAFKRNAFKRVCDTLGVERYQSVPLYSLSDSAVPVYYGRDGSLVKLLKMDSVFVKISTLFDENKEWIVPKKYFKSITDSVVFKKVIFVDRVNQNIATLEKVDSSWLIRSMNPATTGLHKPPHKQETPTGMFIVQEKKVKMFYTVDGATDIGGYAPTASRFTNGAYIHGIPINLPRTETIEFSPSLGTTPRSHMCVRTPTSLAKFIFDWVSIDATLVFVFD